MTWMNMIVKQESNIEQRKCDHCNRVFVRESTLLKHICEQKRRWLDKDKLSNRIAYSAWKQYYQQHHPNKRSLEYKDFITNSFYSAFTKFGIYCAEIHAINPGAYAIYLVKNKISIDNWASDRNYTKYLIEYMRLENHLDAVKRSLECLVDIANDENIQLSDVFKFINGNKLCYMLASGKISPWVLYHSKTGVEFLSKLDQSQVSLVMDYIDPEKWNIKFKRDAENVSEVKALLQSIPL